ncbi:hypothetical protein C8C83_0825 [Flavobacterium sp. 90]|uniref:hypothetical protein n=1 Tax=unclassified Flavobacterium TaxID=196869 RepID=UPI000EB530F1|nr:MULTISPECIES: hypothetical protein [unclassified Flavobacterium]RKR09206.1 hypothetical protein C8C82_1124 [Flavobacterium sp. 81]TCK52990.1 hypothetical protein C8C83_0825 [Flavobacterium sp. 90]
MENKRIHLNYNFFISFPGGYRIQDALNDNIDVYIVLKNDYSKVYIATIFTLENIKMIMKNNREKWFWASDFFIVKDLSRNTIYQSIDDVLKNESLNIDTMFSKANMTYFEIFESNKIREDLL